LQERGKGFDTEDEGFAERSRRRVMIRNSGRYRIVLVTCGSIAEARRIGRSVVERKLAACANIVPSVESIYRWKGKVERAQEVLVVLKTTAKHLPKLEREVKQLHSYDLPEFIAIPIVAGSKEYLRWIATI
jgi:periplasmic divalent cation tolerance protein